MNKIKFFEIIDGVLNNNDINGANWKDWSDPGDMVDFYAPGETLTTTQKNILQSCIDENKESKMLENHIRNNQLEVFQGFAQNSDVWCFANGLIRQRGGYRPNSGRKSDGIARRPRAIRLSDAEYEQVKKFLETIRK